MADDALSYQELFAELRSVSGFPSLTRAGQLVGVAPDALSVPSSPGTLSPPLWLRHLANTLIDGGLRCDGDDVPTPDRYVEILRTVMDQAGDLMLADEEVFDVVLVTGRAMLVSAADVLAWEQVLAMVEMLWPVHPYEEELWFEELRDPLSLFRILALLKLGKGSQVVVLEDTDEIYPLEEVALASELVAAANSPTLHARLQVAPVVTELLERMPEITFPFSLGEMPEPKLCGWLVGGGAFEGTDLEGEDLLEPGLVYRIIEHIPHAMACLNDFVNDRQGEFEASLDAAVERDPLTRARSFNSLTEPRPAIDGGRSRRPPTTWRPGGLR